MHDERRVAGERVVTLGVVAGAIIRRLRRGEIGDVETGPLLFGGVPPDEFLPLAPRAPVRAGRGAVVHDAAVGRPREPPAVPEIIPRLTIVRAVAARLGIDAGIDPASAFGGSVRFQLAEPRDQR